jgi:beta-lactamase class A
MRFAHWTRRQFLFATTGTLVTACAHPHHLGEVSSFAEVEANVGGRVGVFALDTGNGQHLAHRADERFAMCSTFKWVLVAAILARVERAQLSLDEHVAYTTADLLEYAPITRKHVGDGFMTIGALAEAAITVSDNTAGNLLLAKIGGPSGFTKFVRSLGDSITRLDRIEPALNSNDAGDLRDTTSPRAMVELMRKILGRGVLSRVRCDRLLGWLWACETGKDRLRAGFPQNWTIGDKTGSGDHGAANDVAIAFPPDRPPILVASYLSDGTSARPAQATAHAQIGRIVARWAVRSQP